jgi:DNA-binding FrmR family transcriptional regulator
LPSAPDPKRQLERRLARIEGQVRGLRRIIAEDRPSTEVLQQIASVHGSLRGVSAVLLRKHVEEWATGIPSEDRSAAGPCREELVDAIYRYRAIGSYPPVPLGLLPSGLWENGRSRR